MIGQKKLLKWVDNNINSFPHFIVLIGPRGCGKRSLSKTIAHKLSFVYSECEIKVDSVREVISTANNSTTNVLYCFADADNMTNAAKNAMLKITEEPPEHAYFCLTITDDSSLLDTVKSRATVLYMQEYTKDELKEYYYKDTDDADRKSEAELFCSVCSTPGEIDLFTQYGADFYDYVKLVVDNIAEVEPANAFKSSNKLALKNDEGYDLVLFWKCFIQICIERLTPSKYSREQIIRYCDGIIETTPYLNKATKLGVNKQQLYDSWVFIIRSVWCV